MVSLNMSADLTRDVVAGPTDYRGQKKRGPEEEAVRW